MSKKFQLQIPAPCHENWDKMTPVDKGRFCDSCQKAVHDFTGMSDAQLIAFFKKPSTGSVCGRFLGDQLNRDFEMPRKRLPWLKYLFQIVIPALLISTKAKAQGEVIRIKGDTILLEPSKEPVKCKTSETMPVKIDTTGLTGKIISGDGKPIPYATITIKGTFRGVMANERGEFKIRLFENWQQVTLNVSCVGFESKEIVVSSKGPQQLLVVLGDIVLGQTVYVGLIVRKKKPAPPLLQRIFKDTAFNFFKVYPNPVVSGSPVKIELRKQEHGEYNVELVNQGGQIVYTSILSFKSKRDAASFNIPIVTPGSYILQLTNRKTGKKHAEKIIIQ